MGKRSMSWMTQGTARVRRLFSTVHPVCISFICLSLFLFSRSSRQLPVKCSITTTYSLDFSFRRVSVQSATFVTRQVFTSKAIFLLLFSQGCYLSGCTNCTFIWCADMSRHDQRRFTLAVFSESCAKNI